VLADEVAFVRSSLTVARTITARAGGAYYVLSGYGVLDRTGALWVTGGLRPPDRPSTTGDADWVGAALTDSGWVALGRDRTVAGWG
jgi:hypothetical protein